MRTLILCFARVLDLLAIDFYSPTVKTHIQTFVPVPENSQRRIENGLYIFSPEDIIPLHFNITFVVDARPLCAMEVAVAQAGLAMESAGFSRTRQWLFPEPSSKPAPTCTKSEIIQENDWVDKGLNHEQRVSAFNM